MSHHKTGMISDKNVFKKALDYVQTDLYIIETGTYFQPTKSKFGDTAAKTLRGCCISLSLIELEEQSQRSQAIMVMSHFSGK